MNRSFQRSLRASYLAVPLLLAGCFNEPPACSDMDVAKTLKNIILGEVEKGSAFFATKPKAKALMDRFSESLTFSIGNVRSDGYNLDSKTRMCKAQLTIASGAESQAHDIVYTIQLTENKDGDSMVVLDDHRAIVGPLAGARVALAVLSDAGDYAGTYKCDGVDGATSGPRGPFQQEVGFTVEDPTMGMPELRRTTQGGGVEKLSVNLSSGAITGTGQNSPDDQWKTSFAGQFNDLEYAGRGAITALDGEVLRRCELRLTQTPVAELPSLSKLTYMGSAFR